MKKLMITVFLSILLIPGICFADEIADSLFDSGVSDTFSDAADKSSNIDAVYKDFDFSGFAKKIANAENVFKPDSIVKKGVHLFFGSVAESARLLTVLIALAVVGGIITNLESSFNSKSTSEIAFFAFYTMYIGILTVSFYTCVKSAKDAVEQQSAFLQAATPTYISMLIATGSVASATAVKPILLYFTSLISIAVKDFLIPASLMIFVMSVINNLSGKIHITKFVNLARMIVTRTLTVIMTVFVTLLTLSGMGANGVDKFSVRAAKYAAQNFVPVVGNVLSSTVDTVFASAAVVKNALGVAGIAVIAIICIYPIIKFAALILIYRLAASVIEPIADKRISNAVNEAASGISMLFSLLVSVTVVFSLSIALLTELAAGGG